jgi:NAD(P)-dependent dehydrogenase (short-subunit alcohol dehydrogenase family)
MGLLEGKVCVITAAGSGMGKASAKIFAREGARLVISDISGAEDQTAAEIGGGEVVARRCDAASEAQVAELIGLAVATWGRLDALLNVAGLPYGCLLEDVQEEMFDRAIDVSLKSAFWGTKHAIPHMKVNGGGAIVNFSSMAGLMPSPNASVYSAAKAGVAQLTRSTALDYGRFNIRANAICPGMIETEGMGAEALRYAPHYRTACPMGRAGKAEDAGELAAFLASDRASYISGVAIPLDGAWSVSRRGQPLS